MVAAIPGKTEMVEYTGDRVQPVNIRRRKVQLHMERPLVIGQRRRIDDTVFVPGEAGKEFIAGREVVD